MTIERQLHEFVRWSVSARVVLGNYKDDLEASEAGTEFVAGTELIDARLRELETLLDSVKQFTPTPEQVKQWEQERRDENPWMKSPTQK